MAHPKPSTTAPVPTEDLYPKVVLYHLHLHLALGDGRERLPVYLGSTVRGILAASFRQLVCVTQAPVCDGCLLLNRCPYPYIFETPPPPHMPEALRKRFHQAPRPYVFQVPRIYRGEPVLSLGLVLVGRAIDYLPYVIYVLEQTGQTKGLGRSRVRYTLAQVIDNAAPETPVIYTAAHGIVQETVQPITWSGVMTPTDRDIDSITLEFLTPLRLKKYGGYQDKADRITFTTLVELLLGRLEALGVFHCGAAWGEHTGLREAARDIQVSAKHMQFQQLQRYSNRHKQKLPLDGLVGTMSFQGPLAPFLPLLRMGALVHIGAGTAFGLGQYRIEQSY